jgi:DNA end-binding protein Ku
MAKEAFAVIREGMKGKAGIGKVALYGREYLIKVQPREQGLVMYTLRHANEIRSMDAIEELADMRRSRSRMKSRLARQVIRPSKAASTSRSYRDEYQVRACATSSTPRSKDVRSCARKWSAAQWSSDLMDALRKSLSTISADPEKERP